MPEIVVVGSLKSKPDRTTDTKAALSGLVAPTHEERGCILYALHQGVDDPTRFVFLERWSSREDLDAHLASAHISAFLRRTDELLAEPPEVTVYEPVPGGEPEKGVLATSR
jgi:quinol monooxygenase YgiN